MAEWALLIFVLVVLGLTYTAARILYDTSQVIVPWLIAAVIIAIGLGAYIMNKVNETGGEMLERYQIEE